MNVSGYNKEQLKDYIEKTNNLDSDVSSIISNPYFCEELFHMVIKKVYKKENVSTLLNLPYMNSDALKILVDRCEADQILFASFLRNSFLTQEIYDLILTKNPVGVDDLLLQSPFASEKTCIAILSSTTPTKDTYLKVINSQFFGSKVIDKIIEVFPADNDVIMAVVQKGIATQQQIDKILEKCIETSGRKYKESIQYIIENYACATDLLVKYASEDVDSESYEFVVNSKYVTKEVLLKLVESAYAPGAKLIIKSHAATDEVLLAIINKNFVSNSYGTRTSYNNEIYEEILKKPGIGEAVLCAILAKTGRQDIRDKIMDHPAAGTDTRIMAMVSKQHLASEDLDKLFAMNGLNADHLITLMKKQPCLEVYRRVMNSSLANQELYHAIIKCIYEDKIQYYQTAVDELLQKDLDERNLCYILTFQQDYDMVKKVISHPNAKLNVYKKVNILADKMREPQRDEIFKLAAKTKRRVMSEIFEIEEEKDYTEALRRNVEDGLSTMLWGPSGVGKSSRVREIDPTAIEITLKPNMVPEEIVGGREPNGQPGEEYPPHWYVLLCKKCQAEPDRMHILFIDEITNVRDTIKGLVWEIVGNRCVGRHSEWPLPQNCTVVLAGNRPEESTAVQIDAAGGVIAAPLHNRICQMMEIKFNIDEWQEWALEINPKTGKPRIHPIVYSFCVPRWEKVMFTPFDPENIAQPFLTPRKWEQLSDTIYAAEARGPRHHVSYDRIKRTIGDNAIYEAFIEHYERLPIDMNMIIMGEYTEEDFPTIEDKYYALGIILAQYNGDQETIESFILECLGDEFLSVYNSMKKRNAEEQDSAGQNTTGGKK